MAVGVTGHLGLFAMETTQNSGRDPVTILYPSHPTIFIDVTTSKVFPLPPRIRLATVLLVKVKEKSFYWD